MSFDQQEEKNIEKQLGLVGAVGIHELADEMGRQFGGVKGIVRKMREAWESPDTPAAVKNNIMTFIIKTQAQVNDERAATDFEAMTDSEIAAFIKRLMDKHGGKLPAHMEIVNGSGSQ